MFYITELCYYLYTNFYWKNCWRRDGRYISGCSDILTPKKSLGLLSTSAGDPQKLPKHWRHNSYVCATASIFTSCCSRGVKNVPSRITGISTNLSWSYYRWALGSNRSELPVYSALIWVSLYWCHETRQKFTLVPGQWHMMSRTFIVHIPSNPKGGWIQFTRTT